MDPMLDAPEEDLAAAEAADEPTAEHVGDTADETAAAPAEAPAAAAAGAPAGDADEPPEGFRWPTALQPAATRRVLLLAALGGLLIAGLVTAIPAVGTGPGRLAGYIDSNPVPSTGTKTNAAFNRATGGDCLMWPDRTPESASIV